MKYLVFIWADGLPAPEDLAVMQREIPGWAEEMDGRGVRLTLSKLGRRIYSGLIRAAAERDKMVRNCLSEREAKVFEHALSKIASEAPGP